MQLGQEEGYKGPRVLWVSPGKSSSKEPLPTPRIQASLTLKELGGSHRTLRASKCPGCD